jgi:glycogen debranching enzyme
VRIELRMSWALHSDEQPGELATFADLERDRKSIVDPWVADRPVPGGVDDVARIVRASVEDLAALRIRVEDGMVLAAGVPWFLTVFGRDSLLASWMALPVDPALAVATLRHLARWQATTYDLATDAEPGKIQHEERTGVAAQRWHERYYGTVDATSLFVMLAAEHLRWTGDDTVARDLEAPLRAAVGWILSRVEEDELGLVGFWRRGERGLDVQSWKDSPDSQRDHSGRVATGLIRPIEAQGYAVAALRGAARIATAVWKDEVVASEWAAAARVLERRLVERTLVELPPARLSGEDDPRQGGYLAQGVDSTGHAIDSLCSNPGHLLWTESIADPSLRARVVAQLTSEALDSGWGIRTMSTLDRGYNTLAYHNGTVWPHDNSLVAWGLARHGRWQEAQRIARRLLEASSYFDHQLPEVFAGFSRTDTPFPIPYPTAARPQAWAAGAPVLLLQLLLGLEPDRRRHVLGSVAPGDIPSWAGNLRLTGVRAFDQAWDVLLDGGEVTVEQA